MNRAPDPDPVAVPADVPEPRASGWVDAAQRYRSVAPPDALEAALLARFGELRAAAAAGDGPVQQSAPAAGRRGWRVLAGRLRWPHPALAGAVSLGVVLVLAAPWWLPLLGGSSEQTTPFLLVAEPSGGRLDVAQMVRVSVSREAMLEFGIPVPPQKLQEPVGAEMLLGQRGELLAVRFIEKPERRRLFFY